MSEQGTDRDRFVEHLKSVVLKIEGRNLDSYLEADLNSAFPSDGDWFESMTELCLRGCEQGWLCEREAGGIKFGRAVSANQELQSMSVDVVEMDDIVGPHHRHPNGEIDLVIPIDEHAKFDGSGAGWKVYEADTAHYPTVTGGKAIVVYLLPQGAIEFCAGPK